MSSLPNAPVDDARVRRNERLCLAAIVVVAVALFAPTLRGRFVIDDHAAIASHPGVTGAWSPRALFGVEYWGAPFGTGNGLWRPIATLTYFVDLHLGRGAPWVFHATNLGLFAITLVVADRFLRRWAGAALSSAARLGAVAVFASLAIHVDVVPMIVGRTDLLATIFSLVALDLAATSALGPFGAALLVVTSLAAALSKESAMPMAVVAAAFVLGRARRGADRAVSSARAITASVACLAALAALIAFRTSHGILSAGRPTDAFENPLIGHPLTARLSGGLAVVTRYLEHTFAPGDLCPDYGYSAFAPSAPRVVIGALLVAIAIASYSWTFRRRRPVAEALLALAGSYVAGSHLIVAGTVELADRLFFFPSFWLVVIAALALDPVFKGSPRHRWIVAFATSAFGLGQALVLGLNVPMRRDQDAIARYGVAACPQVARIREYRADAAHEAAQPEEEAWSLLMAATIRRRFPAPISDETYPAAWEERAVADRVALLRAREGDGTILDNLFVAHATARSKGAREAAEVLRRWGLAIATR